MVGLLALSLLVQTPVHTAAAPVEPPVRVWLPDTVLPVGAPARVFVQLADSGYLAVLQVEPSGRIRVLYPAHPTDPDFVPGGATFVVAGLDDSTTFRVSAPGTGTLLAVRSWTPFRFDGLIDGPRWDYARALLLQPTAGNPFAALLDIADRIADGEAYAYDLAGYRTPGAVAVRRTTTDSICGNCFTARPHHTDTGVPADGSNSAIAIDHSYAAASGGYTVDCSSATLVDSFCGVEDNRVSNTYDASTTEMEPPAVSTTYVYPLYPRGLFPFLRRRIAPRSVPLPPPATALNLRSVPGQIVPPPPRRIPRIVVTQPTAPSRPWPAAEPGAAIPAAAAPIPAGTASRRFAVVRAADGARQMSTFDAASAGATSSGSRMMPAARAPMAAAPTASASGAAAAPAAPPRVVVPTRAQVSRARH
jgi:hypothetical protein